MAFANLLLNVIEPVVAEYLKVLFVNITVKGVIV